MRLTMAAALGATLFSSAKAGVDVNQLAQCDERNALDDISVDAALWRSNSTTMDLFRA